MPNKNKNSQLIEEKIVYKRIRNGKLEIVHATVRKRPDNTYDVKDYKTGQTKIIDHKLQVALYSILEHNRPENYDYFSEYGRKYIGKILELDELTNQVRKLDNEDVINVANQFIDKVLKEERLEKSFNLVYNFLKSKIPEKYHRYLKYEVKDLLLKDLEKAKENFELFLNKPDKFLVRKTQKLYEGKNIKTIGSVRGRGKGEGYVFFTDSRTKHPELLNMVQTLKYIHNKNLIDKFVKKLVPYIYQMKEDLYLGKNKSKISLGKLLEENPHRPIVFMNLPKTIYKEGQKDITDYLMDSYVKYLKRYEIQEKGIKGRKYIALHSYEFSDGKVFEAKNKSKFTRTENIIKYYGHWKSMEELGMLRSDIIKKKIPDNAIVIIVDDIITTGASVQSFLNYIGDTINRDPDKYEGIYSLVLHNNNYKETITDKLRREFK